MKQKLKSEQTIRKIKESSLKLFAKKGYTAASVEDIMKEAGYTKGAFYAHFKSKEELFLQIMDERMYEHQSNLMGLFEKEDEKVINEIDNLLNQLIQQTEKEQWAAIFFEFLANANRSENVRLRMARMYEEWREFLVRLFSTLQQKDLIQKTIDPQLIAQTVIALFDGFNIQAHVDSKVDSRRQIQIISSLLKK